MVEGGVPLARDDHARHAERERELVRELVREPRVTNGCDAVV